MLAGLAGDGFDPFDQVVDFDLGPVQFDDQQRLHVERIAGVDEVLGGVDGGFVHHLHAAGDDAGADDGGDAVAGAFVGRKAQKQRPGGFRLLQDADRDLGDDA